MAPDATNLVESQCSVHGVPRPFLWLFLSAASSTVQQRSDPTIWETEAESGRDGVVWIWRIFRFTERVRQGYLWLRLWRTC